MSQHLPLDIMYMFIMYKPAECFPLVVPWDSAGSGRN